MAKPSRDPPYCTVLLAVAALVCHGLALHGNLRAAWAMKELGESAAGWSDVGIGLSRALSSELEPQVLGTSAALTGAISVVQEVRSLFDQVLGLLGSVVDEVVHRYRGLQTPQTAGSGGAAAALVAAPAQTGAVPEQVRPLLDAVWQNVTQGNTTLPDVADFKQALRPALVAVSSQLVGGVAARLADLLALLRPALLQIGRWLVSFGDAAQASLEAFSKTLDQVQKLFDELTSGASLSAGAGEAQMVHETYTLFDVDNIGHITVHGLQGVADMFGLPAFEGRKGAELFRKYDRDHSGRISRKEFRRLVQDESIPGAMVVVLRTYATRLAEVAGNMAAATMRGEVAEAVAHYLALACAKNKTQVRWASDALTNGSLPTAFTAAVLRQLALGADDADRLTTADIGARVVLEMLKLHPAYVGECLALLAQPAYWDSEGFDPADQPRCVERVTAWIAASPRGREALQQVPLPARPGTAALLADGTDSSLASVPALMRAAVEGRSHSYAARGRAGQSAEADAYASACSLVLRRQLLGAAALAPSAADPEQQRATRTGQQARLETLLFARQLAGNASAAALEYQKMCFEFSGRSGGALDSFASQLQAMVKKVQGFLSQMEEFATPTGIERVEGMVRGFGASAAGDIVDMLLQQVDTLLPTDDKLRHTLGAATAVWTELFTLLASVLQVLPTVVDDMRYARQEISSVASSLNTVFSTFKEKGPPIFDWVAAAYTELWAVYFVVFALLTACVVFYSFWASGWFGGPSAGSAEGFAPPSSAPERLRVCRASCGACFQAYQDSSLCMWSAVLLMQVVVLLLFLVSVLLCVFAGLQAFLREGCAPVYMLGDNTICEGVLGTLARWLETFWRDSPVSIGRACEERHLTTCRLIGENMQPAVVRTTFSSIAAAVISFYMIVESAILHERARWSRALEQECKSV